MYIKPVIIESNDISEGIFAASGVGSFTVKATPKGETLSNGKWVWDLDLYYSGNEECKNQNVTITFNQSVSDFTTNKGELTSANSGSVMTFTLSQTFRDGNNKNFQISCVNPVNPEIRPAISVCSATVA